MEHVDFFCFFGVHFEHLEMIFCVGDAVGSAEWVLTIPVVFC